MAPRSASFLHGEDPSALTLTPGKARHQCPPPSLGSSLRATGPEWEHRVPCYEFPVTGSARSQPAAHGQQEGPSPMQKTGVRSMPNAQVLKHLWGFRKEGGSNY